MANGWLLEPLPMPVIIGSSVGAGEPAYLGNDYAGVIWRSIAADSHAIVIDLGADRVVDAGLLFGLVVPAGTTADVKVATSAQGIAFAGGDFYGGEGIPAYAGSVPLTGGAGVLLWMASAAYPPVRYIRIGFVLPAAGVVQISRAAFGQRIQLQRNFGNGGSVGVRDLGSLDFSARGILQRRRGRKMRTAAVTFSNINKDEVEAYTKPLMERIGNTEMIAFVSDPAPDAQRMNRCYFGPMVGDLSHTHRKATFWEAKVNIVSIF